VRPPMDGSVMRRIVALDSPHDIHG
jgi:hypothetical protein